ANHLFQSRLINRHLTPAQHLHLARVLVHTHHVIAQIGKDRAGHQAYVSRPDNAYVHSEGSSRFDGSGCSRMSKAENATVRRPARANGNLTVNPQFSPQSPPPLDPVIPSH